MSQRPEIETRDEEAGFSLLELMVVIVILGILATIVVINVLPAQDQASLTKAQTDISRLSTALELYRAETRRYPSTEDGIEVLTEAPEGGVRSEPFITGALPDDPWGNPYQYLYPGERGVYDLYSLGADGRLGGEGLNADIGNWDE
jgi:general secretion pathway protein G